MFMPKVTMASIFNSTKLLRPLKEVQNTSEISISNQNNMKFSSRRKSSGVIHFSAVVKYSWADSASGLMTWPLETPALLLWRRLEGQHCGKFLSSPEDMHRPLLPGQSLLTPLLGLVHCLCFCP